MKEVLDPCGSTFLQCFTRVEIENRTVPDNVEASIRYQAIERVEPVRFVDDQMPPQQAAKSCYSALIRKIREADVYICLGLDQNLSNGKH